MNISLIITGLLALLLGLIGLVLDKPRSAREKRDVPMDYTLAKSQWSSWSLLIIGIAMIIYGLFNTD